MAELERDHATWNYGSQQKCNKKLLFFRACVASLHKPREQSHGRSNVLEYWYPEVWILLSLVLILLPLLEQFSTLFY